MKIALCSSGTDLDSTPSPVFGRCPYFLFVDDETEEVIAAANPAADASGGAGVQASQFVVERGAEVLLAGRVGPSALEVIVKAGVKVYDSGSVDARTALSRWKEGVLSEITTPSSPRHGGGN